MIGLSVSFLLFSLTACYIDSSFNRHKVIVAAKPFAHEQHTGVNLGQMTADILEENGIKRSDVVSLIRDGASNNNVAFGENVLDIPK